MPSYAVNQALDRAVRKVPGLRRLPLLRLLALGEIALLAQDHLNRLDRDERRRLMTLIRIGRGRRGNLTESERQELSELIARVAPRELAAHSASKLSPVPIPGLIVRRAAGSPGKDRRWTLWGDDRGA